MEQARPRREPRPLDVLHERGAQVGVRVAVSGDDVGLPIGRLVEHRLQVGADLREDRDHADSLIHVVLGFLGVDRHAVLRPVDVFPLQPQVFARAAEAGVPRQGDNELPLWVRGLLDDGIDRRPVDEELPLRVFRRAAAHRGPWTVSERVTVDRVLPDLAGLADDLSGVGLGVIGGHRPAEVLRLANVDRSGVPGISEMLGHVIAGLLQDEHSARLQIGAAGDVIIEQLPQRYGARSFDDARGTQAAAHQAGVKFVADRFEPVGGSLADGLIEPAGFKDPLDVLQDFIRRFLAAPANADGGALAVGSDIADFARAVGAGDDGGHAIS